MTKLTSVTKNATWKIIEIARGYKEGKEISLKLNYIKHQNRSLKAAAVKCIQVFCNIAVIHIWTKFLEILVKEFS